MKGIQRRGFLTAASTLAAPAVSAAAVMPHGPVASASTGRWNLLAVAPRSRKVPAMEQDYRKGVELGLSLHGPQRFNVRWIAAPGAPSAAARAILNAAHEATALHAVVGWLPPDLLERIAPAMHEREIPLWITDSGADRPSYRIPEQVCQLHVRHSLELCDAAAVLAKEVRMRIGTRVVLATGWMESGYDFVSAFQGAYQTLGGRILFRHVAGLPSQKSEFEGLFSSLVQLQPDGVVALHSGSQASRFCRWWQENAEGLGCGLAGMSWLMDAGAPATAVMTGTWPDRRAGEAGWVEAFDKVGLNWTAAALLGAEAGTSLGAAMAHLPQTSSPQQIVRAWRAHALQGPRGLRSWTNGARDSEGLLWAWGQGGSLRLRPLPRPWGPLLNREAQSGWTNGYLLT